MFCYGGVRTIVYAWLTESELQWENARIEEPVRMSSTGGIAAFFLRLQLFDKEGSSLRCTGKDDL